MGWLGDVGAKVGRQGEARGRCILPQVASEEEGDGGEFGILARFERERVVGRGLGGAGNAKGVGFGTFYRLEEGGGSSGSGGNVHGREWLGDTGRGKVAG